MRPRAAAAAATGLAIAVALLGGCGGGQEGGDDGAVGPAGAERAPEVAVQTATPGFDPAAVFRAASPGVVTIRAIFGNGGGEGSGFVFDENGLVVTNAHVVTEGEGADREEAGAVYVEFPDRNTVPARVLGFDPFADVALLKLNPEGLDLQPLALGDDSELVVGQPVAVIGSPFGEQQSLSVGIVSATDRSVRSLTRFQIEGAIQTDASINPGNSGGPLLDAAARVIGISQQIETSSGANDGVGFAVPISAVRRSVRQLRGDGTIEYAYIGVSTQGVYPQLAKRLGLDAGYGGLVADVVPGGPAAEAGLEGGEEEIRFQGVPYVTGGDTILAVDGHKIVRPDDLARHISALRPGQTVTLEVEHADGGREEIEVTLGDRPVGNPAG